MKWLISLLAAMILSFSVWMTGCESGYSDGTETKESESDEVADGIVESLQDDYLINGFDIRTIGEYPQIEAAIRLSANVEYVEPYARGGTRPE